MCFVLVEDETDENGEYFSGGDDKGNDVLFEGFDHSVDDEVPAAD